VPDKGYTLNYKGMIEYTKSRTLVSVQSYQATFSLISELGVIKVKM